MWMFLTPEVIHLLTAGLIPTCFVLKLFGGVFSRNRGNIKHILVSEKYLLQVQKTMFSDQFLTVLLLFLLLTAKVPRDKDVG